MSRRVTQSFTQSHAELKFLLSLFCENLRFICENLRENYINFFVSVVQHNKDENMYFVYVRNQKK